MTHPTLSRSALAARAVRPVALACLALLGGFAAAPAPARDAEDPGRVELSLADYQRLLEAGRTGDDPRPAPASWSLGTASAAVTVREGLRPHARVEVVLPVEVLEDEWVLVPLLPSGTAVEDVRADGRPIRLVPGPEGLGWATRGRGSHQVRLVYRADAQVSDGGTALALPLPRAAGVQLAATLPGEDLDVTVVPASGVEVSSAGGSTRLAATVPATSAVQIAWRRADRQPWALGRAAYRADLRGEALRWTGTLRVDLFVEGPVALPLLPASATLTGIRVDDREVPIVVENGRFAAWIEGRGAHRVSLEFVTPVVSGDGPPRTVAALPAIPVSALEIRLPGRKEVEVTPAADVAWRTEGETTIATASVSMADRVEVSWSEAVPEAVRTEARRNAALIHLVHAEEGVMVVRALAELEITRGTTSRARMRVPEGVQVNRVDSEAGIVADWSIGEDRVLQVFLDREVEGRLLLEIELDRALPPGVVRDGAGEVGAVPLLEALDTHRQRGMVALLSGREMSLGPQGEDGLTRVGENQLPPWARERVERTVAHAFKYVETPVLRVDAAAPTREEVRFDARVDSLVSLGEVTLREAVEAEVDVKAGSLLELELRLPAGAGLLSLTAPSLRRHVLGDAGQDGSRPIRLEFTQEMEGRFPVELVVERVLEDGGSAVEVPLVSVPAAEVEQGRIAVEALAAVEVQPGAVAHLTPIDPRELPRQLVLRTTSPILHAWKYVRPEAATRLELAVTRHRLLEVEEAAIDRARVTTLVTADGLAVTTARFAVRNSRQQFVKVDLPPGSRVWSALVDGRPEKPALEESGEGAGPTVLLRLIHSTEGFPVELIYESPVDEVQGLGSVDLVLPRPDILVTETRWELWLPTGVRYREPTTNLEVVEAPTPVAAAEMAAAAEDLARREVVAPLRLQVPATGVRIALEKLYANQRRAEPGRVRVVYVSASGARWGLLGTALAALAFWAGIARLVGAAGPRDGRGRAVGAGLALLGLLGVLALRIGFGLSLWPAGIVTLGVVGLRAAGRLWERAWRLAPEA